MQMTCEAERVESEGWQTIDAALQSIAQRRGALDALEARWLRAALRVRIWREVGCVSMADYLERRLGYAPRTASDRVRVALALEELPKLAAALEQGLPHSAVRELTRVCTHANEQRWLDKVRGKTVHEIEGMVSGRRRGAEPGDPAQPNLVGRTLAFEAVRPATEALLRDARRKAQGERGSGELLSDDELLAMLARAFLEGSTGERAKAPYQIAVTLCERCGGGWQASGGRRFALSSAEVERACCDAEHLGSLDGDAPERAAQEVSPSVRRLVHRRSGGRCEIPGCRSTRSLEVHHIVPRSEGGTHDPENCAVLCDGCHAAHHRGAIRIAGTASSLEVVRKREITFGSPANDERDPDALADPHLEGDGLEPRAQKSETNAGVDRGSAGEALDGETSNRDGRAVSGRGGVASGRRGEDTRDPDAVEDAHVGTKRAHDERAAVDGAASGPLSRFELERVRSQARRALVGLGYRAGEAGKAVDLAIDRGYRTLEDVIRAALRACASTS